MAITLHLYYRGCNGNARKFAAAMLQSGTVAQIRAQKGNLQYAYFLPLEDEETVLLIDSWESQAALARHHASSMMAVIAALREQYDLHMTVERYSSAAATTDADEQYLRK